MACLNSCVGITYSSSGVLRSASILLLEIACKNNRIPQQQHPDSCCRYGKTVFMFVEGGCVRRHSQLTPLSGLIYAVFHADSLVLYKLCYLAYTILPSPISGPLVVITYLIKAHCDKGEYISFPAHQRSPDQRDWDVESEALVTEVNMMKQTREESATSSIVSLLTHVSWMWSPSQKWKMMKQAMPERVAILTVRFQM